MIIFDTETTGLDSEINQICQLSYLKIDEEYNVEYAKNFYFKVDRMERGAENVHGLSKELLEELSEGKTFEDCSSEIYEDFKNESELYIAHNIDFDLRFLGEEFERLNLDCGSIYNYNKHFCTMHSYTDIVAIGYNSYYGTYKWPRLEEVLRYLRIDTKDIKEKTKEIFGLSDDDIKAHDSRFDVVATREIARFYNEVDRLERFRKIDNHVHDIEQSLEKIKKYLEFAKDCGEDISAYDLEKFDDFYMNLHKNDRIYEIAQRGAKALSNLAIMEKKEIERRERVLTRAKELDLKSSIKDALKNGTRIKAVIVHAEEWVYSKEVLYYDMQVAEEDMECFNVELIPLGNKYLKLRLNKEGTAYENYQIIEVSNVSNPSEERVFDTGKEEFDIVYGFSAPEIKIYDINDALELNVRDYITVDNSALRLDEIQTHKLDKRCYCNSYDNSDDDEIPF